MPSERKHQGPSYEYLVEANSYIWDGSILLDMPDDMESVVTAEVFGEEVSPSNFIALVPDLPSKQLMHDYARRVSPDLDDRHFVKIEDLHLRLVSTPDSIDPPSLIFRPFEIPAYDVIARLYRMRGRSSYVLLLHLANRRLVQQKAILQKKSRVINAVRHNQMHIVLAYDVDPNAATLPIWSSPITFSEGFHMHGIATGNGI